MDRALTYIFGIGLTSARKILDEADLPYQMNSDDLSGDDVTRIRKIIEADYGIVAEYCKSLDNIFKLSYVARPVIVIHCIHCLRGKSGYR